MIIFLGFVAVFCLLGAVGEKQKDMRIYLLLTFVATISLMTVLQIRG